MFPQFPPTAGQTIVPYLFFLGTLMIMIMVIITMVMMMITMMIRNQTCTRCRFSLVFPMFPPGANRCPLLIVSWLSHDYDHGDHHHDHDDDHHDDHKPGLNTMLIFSCVAQVSPRGQTIVPCLFFLDIPMIMIMVTKGT